MARVLVATQPWGVIWQTTAANPRTSAERMLQVPAAGITAAIDTPVYAASSGATLVSAFTSDQFGRLPGWVEEGAYTITVAGVPERVEATSGTAGGRADAASAAIVDHLADATDAHDASAVSVVPSGSLTGTDAQAALAALAARELALESGHRSIYSLTNYGGVCDGVTDDSAAWQAMIDAASVATDGGIFTWPGPSRIATGIVMPYHGSFHFLGSGASYRDVDAGYLPPGTIVTTGDVAVPAAATGLIGGDAAFARFLFYGATKNEYTTFNRLSLKFDGVLFYRKSGFVKPQAVYLDQFNTANSLEFVRCRLVNIGFYYNSIGVTQMELVSILDNAATNAWIIDGSPALSSTIAGNSIVLPPVGPGGPDGGAVGADWRNLSRRAQFLQSTSFWAWFIHDNMFFGTQNIASTYRSAVVAFYGIDQTQNGGIHDNDFYGCQDAAIYIEPGWVDGINAEGGLQIHDNQFSSWNTANPANAYGAAIFIDAPKADAPTANANVQIGQNQYHGGLYPSGAAYYSKYGIVVVDDPVRLGVTIDPHQVMSGITVAPYKLRGIAYGGPIAQTTRSRKFSFPLSGPQSTQEFIVTLPRNIYGAPDGGVTTNATHVFWAAYNGSKIERALIDGTGQTTGFITGASSPIGVAVDATYVYWCNTAANTIGRANLDGSSPNQSFITGLSDPQGITVDGTYIYWCSSFGNKIGRALLNGTSVNQNFITGCNAPQAVAVNATNIFWCNTGSTTIGRAALDGTLPNQSFVTGCAGPNGVAVDATHVYWTNFTTATIGRCLLDGTLANQSFITGLTSPRGASKSSVALYWGNGGSLGAIGRNTEAVPVPASTVALSNPFAFDATVYVSGGTVTAVAIDGVASGLTSGMFRVPQGSTITLTYTAAPVWQWHGG